MRFRRKSQSPSPPSPSPSQPEVKVDLSVDTGAWGSEIAKMYGLDPTVLGLPARALEAAKPVVPVMKGDEPIRALKAAYLDITTEGVAFAPLNQFQGNGKDHYGPESTAECHCSTNGPYGPYSMALSFSLYGNFYGERTRLNHQRPGHDTDCGFYAWKYHHPFPWQTGTWLLETELYGRVIEHETGYRAEKQRVLRISPVSDLFCEPPFTLRQSGTRIVGRCPHHKAKGHPVSIEKLRRLLNVEIDLNWAFEMREGQ